MDIQKETAAMKRIKAEYKDLSTNPVGNLGITVGTENNNIFLNNKNNKEENNNNILINKQKNEENNNIILNIKGNINNNAHKKNNKYS